MDMQFNSTRIIVIELSKKFVEEFIILLLCAHRHDASKLGIIAQSTLSTHRYKKQKQPIR